MQEISDWFEYLDYRKNHDRDLKVIVIARNSQTGVGKTTFAIDLLQYMDQDFNQDKITFDMENYVRLYNDLPKGSGILWEEAEKSADKRRSMSNENLDISHLWMFQRFREMYTVATLPSRSVLDKRLLELSDVLVIVMQRGLAKPYKCTINDLSGKLELRRFKDKYGYYQRIRFNKIDNEVYKEAKRMKGEYSKKWTDEMMERHG